MKYSLPKLSAKNKLAFDWFPTRAQCFIYRNWGIVTPVRMAEVLGTTEDIIKGMAADMGLEPEPEVLPDWNTRGYITIIRNNWHLLDYSQLCTLLGWDEEQLAYILKEDDFLSVKLGRIKPDTGPLMLETLDTAKINMTKKIRDITLSVRKKLPAPKARPFDFFSDIETIGICNNNAVATAFKYRIIYSYCAIYGDTFIDKDLIDLSFPDEMLAAYCNLGINGIWTQAVLSKLAPYPFDMSLSEGFDKRLDGVNYLIDKLNRYGIKLYLYVNEPRSMPEGFFDDHPGIKGEPDGSGNNCLCVSTQEVQDYLRDSIAYIVRNAPGLGGFITITASENPTNCYSHVKNDFGASCPRCARKKKSEVLALVNRLICEGAHAAKPEIKVFAYTWAWKTLELTEEISKLLPDKVGLICVSEHGVEKEIGGVKTHVIDYSMSIEGPGEFAVKTWQSAKGNRHEALAKVQVNNTWEMASVPFIPVLKRVYDHIKRLIELDNLDGLMLSWTLGGYPSPALQLTNEMSRYKSRELPDFSSMVKELFPDYDEVLLSDAFTAFSDAFDNFPFSLGVAYRAPLQCAPANLLYRENPNIKATMVCYPYNDLNSWRDIFPIEVFTLQLEKIISGWEAGMKKLWTIPHSSSKIMQLIYDCAEAFYLHIRSMYNQVKFLSIDNNDTEREQYIDDEYSVAMQLLEIIGRNPMIGYESSNHYFYTRSNLLEKIINLSYLKKQFD
jgi:hypothetical protein